MTINIPNLQWISKFFQPQPILDILAKPINPKWPPYIQYWTLVHLASGLILAKYIKKAWIALTLLALFEGLEYILIGQGIITTELWLDTLTDIITGMIGFYIGRFVWR